MHVLIDLQMFICFSPYIDLFTFTLAFVSFFFQILNICSDFFSFSLFLVILLNFPF